MHQTVWCIKYIWRALLCYDPSRPLRVVPDRFAFCPQSQNQAQRGSVQLLPHISGTRTALSRVHSSAKGPTSMHFSLDNSWNLMNKSGIFKGLVFLSMCSSVWIWIIWVWVSQGSLPNLMASSLVHAPVLHQVWGNRFSSFCVNLLTNRPTKGPTHSPLCSRNKLPEELGSLNTLTHVPNFNTIK